MGRVWSTASRLGDSVANVAARFAELRYGGTERYFGGYLHAETWRLILQDNTRTEGEGCECDKSLAAECISNRVLLR